MGWGSFGFSAASSLIEAGGSYLMAAKKAKSDKQWQEYRNKMVRLSNAQNQNAVTSNTNVAKARSMLQEKQLRDSQRLTMASTEVAAAAAGTEGKSVRQTMEQVNRNAAKASANRQFDLEQQFLGFQQQRENSALQTLQQTDFSPIPKPTGASQLLGFVNDISSSIKTEFPSSGFVKNKLGR